MSDNSSASPPSQGMPPPTLFASKAFKNQLQQKAFQLGRGPVATMPSAAPTTQAPPFSVQPDDLASFSQHLSTSTRILALCGAGLSASSGLPTFRGAGGYWRNNDAVQLATPEAFARDPGLVWQFYSYRRHMSVRAAPNKAHLALAELARRRPHFLTITQNVDGLSQRAQHPRAQIEYMHGSLATIKCTSFDCDHVETDNFLDPIVPALALPHQRAEAAGAPLEHAPDIADARVPLHEVPTQDLPHCPKCRTALLRPGVVWFGEALPAGTLERIDAFVRQPVDLMLVVGTSAVVHPAAGYIRAARRQGARVAIINTEDRETIGSQLQQGDWFFQGDAGQVMPVILESVIGKIDAWDGQRL